MYDCTAVHALNALLVCAGFCFLCGGTKYKEQKFSMLVNKACCSLLFLACIGLSVPTGMYYFLARLQP